MKTCPAARKCCYGNINGEECGYRCNMVETDHCPQEWEMTEIFEVAADHWYPPEEDPWY